MPKLTDTQLVILAAAAQRNSGAAIPLPESLTVNKGVATSALKSLVKRGLVAERPAALNDGVWRETEDGQRTTLAITMAGLEAVGVEPDLQSGPSAGSTETEPKPQRGNTTSTIADTVSPSQFPAFRRGTKQALLIDLLKRKSGATIADIGEATGWRPHSVRGAISGALKKKLGLNVASETVQGRGRVYRIIAGR